MECKELTKQSGYNVFALGHGGLCMSGPNAQDTYYRYKPAAKKNKCSNGIGIGDHSVVYTFGIYSLCPIMALDICYNNSAILAFVVIL